MNKNTRSAKRNVVIIVSVAIVILILLLIIVVTEFMLMKNKGPKEYNDFAQFKADAYVGFELPPAATDVRMAIDEGLLSKSSFYSFVLEDDELNDYIKKTVEEKYTRRNDDGTCEVVTDEYYNIRVKDIDGVNPDYELDDFPHLLKFDSVINDSVEDYLVIYYYPTNSGCRCYGILYNDKTNRVIEFYQANAK